MTRHQHDTESTCTDATADVHLGGINDPIRLVLSISKLQTSVLVEAAGGGGRGVQPSRRDSSKTATLGGTVVIARHTGNDETYEVTTTWASLHHPYQVTHDTNKELPANTRKGNGHPPFAARQGSKSFLLYRVHTPREFKKKKKQTREWPQAHRPLSTDEAAPSALAISTPNGTTFSSER